MSINIDDLGDVFTRKELNNLKKELATNYYQASWKAEKKLNEYFEKFEEKDKKMLERLEAGEIEKKDYEQWRTSQIMAGKRWQILSEQLAEDYYEADVKASKMIKDKVPDVLAENVNFSNYVLEKTLGEDLGFTLYDRNTVISTLANDPMEIFTPKFLSKARNVKSQVTQIHHATVQSILMGTSSRDLGKEIAKILGNKDFKASMSYARTVLGEAQNRGRYESQLYAKSLGIECYRWWMAVLDSRTRHSHALLDGEKEDEDGTFSNGLRYPNDTSTGDPGEYINCRCTTLCFPDGITPDWAERSLEGLDGMDYEQWKESHRKNLDSKDYNRKEGLELLRTFVEGGSAEIHELSGYDIFGDFHPDLVNKEKLKILDSVFSPAKKEHVVYKGIGLTSGEIKKYDNGKFLNDRISSTSKKKSTAFFYMDNVFDAQDENPDLCPVLFKIKIEKDTPVADIQKLFGKKGMKGFEDEITIGRKTEWNFGKFVKKERFGDEYFEVEVAVKYVKEKAITTEADKVVEETAKKAAEERAKKIAARKLAMKKAAEERAKKAAAKKAAMKKAAEEKAKKAAEERAKKTVPVVDGKDLSKTWKRRPDEFEFDIQDVMAAQGFDGKPQIVAKKEFDSYVKKANGGKGFVAQRTYSAETQKILDSYRDQLYNGEWYVDCSVGGAQYGRGMYVAADYTGKISNGITEEMMHYKRLGDTRYGGRTIVDVPKETQQEWIDEAITKYYGKEALNDPNLRTLIEFEVLPEGPDWAGVSKAVNALGGYDKVPDMTDILVDLRTRRTESKAYVETLTLHPSAKIIKYDDLVGEFKDWQLSAGTRAVENYINYEFHGSDNMKTALQFQFGIGRVTYDEAKEAHSKMPEWELKNINNFIMDAKAIYDDADRQARNIDIGAFAAMLGYDAIDAEGHGLSGSYTVILNRTKCIFLGDD